MKASSLLRHPRRITLQLTATLVILLGVFVAACDTFTAETPSAGATGPAAALPASNVSPDGGCVTGTQPGGALFEICRPPADQRNGILAVYSHGFVFPQSPLGIPTTEAGINVRDFLLARGYDYAATSFHANGLLRPEPAVRDLHNLVVQYKKLHGQPDEIILIGISNGALIGTHAVEKHPNLFDAAVAACAPNGSFDRQVNYFGDILVLFQHFFPGVVSGTPEGIPDEYLAGLATAAAGVGVTPDLYLAGVLQSVLAAPANFAQTGQLLSVIMHTPSIGAGFATPPEGIQTIIRGIIYNVFETNNAVDVLGGAYFDNSDRIYVGSADDAALNAAIARYNDDANAAAQIKAHYEVKARLSIPVVALHTLRDPTVPFWQSMLYRDRLGSDATQHTLVPIERYGHCTFTEDEIAAGLEAATASIAV